MDDFLEEFFPKVYRRKQANLHETDYCKYDDQMLTLFTSSLYYSALISTFAASYVTRNFGRRASILGGSVSFFIGGVINAAAVNIAMLIVGRVLLGLGIGFGNQAVPLYLSEMAPKGIGILLVLCIVLFVFAFGRSWGPLGWLVPSEIFPLETRSAGQSIVVCVNMVFTALIAQSFLPVLCHLKYGIFFLFAGLMFIMTAFIYFFLPETKQVPIDEVIVLFRNHWFWKRFVTDKDARANTTTTTGNKLNEV